MGVNYLMLKLDDQLVSFFDDKDQQTLVKGKLCRMPNRTQRQTANGHELRVVGTAVPSRVAVTTNPIVNLQILLRIPFQN